MHFFNSLLFRFAGAEPLMSIESTSAIRHFSLSLPRSALFVIYFCGNADICRTSRNSFLQLYIVYLYTCFRTFFPSLCSLAMLFYLLVNSPSLFLFFRRRFSLPILQPLYTEAVHAYCCSMHCTYLHIVSVAVKFVLVLWGFSLLLEKMITFRSFSILTCSLMLKTG